MHFDKDIQPDFLSSTNQFLHLHIRQGRDNDKNTIGT